MKNTNTDTLILIDGQFNTEEAREILLNVFNAKIQFHELRNFSVMERFGKPDLVAQQRVPALRKSLQEALAIVAHAGKHKKRLKVYADVRINLVEND
ncbi:MAG: hypothetical protein ACK4E0_10645 [Chitinophagaceae bacterium]